MPPRKPPTNSASAPRTWPENGRKRGAAIILAAFGWLFLCLAVGFLLAKAIGGSNAWVWSAVAMAGAHLGSVALLVLGLKSKLATALFPMTTGELKKDQEWLDQQTRT